jgi:hypothetical protein
MRFLPARFQSQDLEATRDQTEFSLDGYIAYLNEFIYNGNAYFTQGPQQTQPGQKQEVIGPAYRAITDLAYKSDSVVFSCMQTRARHFNQARFQFQRLRDGRLTDYFGTPELQPLETPWVGGTTQSLLTRMIMHVDLGGNCFVVRKGDGLAMLRPDWVTIVIGSNTNPEIGAWATDAEVLGYVYSPGGYGTQGYETETFLPEDVAHWAPIADPEARFRGMSWLTPLIREVMADKAATESKLRFFENPTPNMVVKFDTPDLKEYEQQVKAFKEAHRGPRNAFKWMFTAAGVDATPVGANMQQLDYRLVTGAGETRIAAAAGTPPVIVGLSEGLQGSSLNTGNYQAARRNFVDGVILDLWNSAAGALSNIINVPGDANLSTDPRDISFLKEDAVEQAEILQKESITIRYLVDAGYKPDTVIAAVTSNDLSLLEHSGLFSVQLQAATAPKQGLFAGVPVPNTEPGAPPPAQTAPTNGNGNTPPAPPARSDTHVHFDYGAFQLPAAPDVNIHEGAIRAEITTPDVHVEAPVTFEEGSIQAHPAEVTFEEGAIRTDVAAPDVHVDAPQTTIEPGAVVVEAPPPANITVEPTRIEEGAIQVNVEPPDVDVTIERAKKRRVDYGDGRSAVVTDGEARRIDFDDGDSVTITEMPEDEDEDDGA